MRGPVVTGPSNKRPGALRVRPLVRLGDVVRTERHKSNRGFTLLELIVTLAILGTLTGIAVPHFQRNTYGLWGTQQQLLGDLRHTRADALTKGDHFRFDVIDASSYKERRLELVGTEWVATGPPIRTRTLPPGITFTTGVGSQFEFNTRGLLVDADSAGTLTLTESGTSHLRAITVWPSGQVSVQ